MASYNVLVRDPPGDLALVRDGYSAPAHIGGPIWFVWHRAWLGACLWLLGAALISGFALLARLPAEAVIAAFAAFAGLMALEASEFRRRSLIGRGYRIVDTVEAHATSEAEIRFLARHVVAPRAEMVRLAPSRQGAQKAENVGLFLNGT
jgi:hypothetical protein